MVSQKRRWSLSMDARPALAICANMRRENAFARHSKHLALWTATHGATLQPTSLSRSKPGEPTHLARLSQASDTGVASCLRPEAHPYVKAHTMRFMRDWHGSHHNETARKADSCCAITCMSYSMVFELAAGCCSGDVSSGMRPGVTAEATTRDGLQALLQEPALSVHQARPPDCQHMERSRCVGTGPLTAYARRRAAKTTSLVLPVDAGLSTPGAWPATMLPQASSPPLRAKPPRRPRR